MTRGPQTWITELTPLSFLARSAGVYPDKTAIVHGAQRRTYAEFARDAQRLARGLRASGVAPGDRVACLLPNVPAMLHAHFGVPLAGAVLVAVNTRLSAEEVRYILDHSGATVLVVDSALMAAVEPIRESLETVREVVVHVDPEGPDAGASVEGATYDDLLDRGNEGEDLPWDVEDERGTISINYTSGTTGKPKGVQYHHRGAYLNSLGEIIQSYHDPSTVYLWTLPMFHCNGWCTPWGITAIGGTHVCLREVRGDAIWAQIDEHRVTHLNGAPTVVTTIMNAPEARTLDYALVVTTAGAPPSPTTILEMERMGFRIVHVYGLTETYGPYTVCQWQDEWTSLEATERARLQARQGVGMIQTDAVRVVEVLDDEALADPASARLVDVPADGTTMGEIVMHGNNVMSGYYRDPDATAKAFAGGWYHSGDLGVMHPDGYVELRDRAKDVIISGGENISTVEVEQAVLSHEAVLEAAVVGVPDERWGERPKAFVVLRQGRAVEPEEVIEHVKTAIARYKAPREVEVVEELPKTSTGKIQKFELRAKEWGGQERQIRG